MKAFPLYILAVLGGSLLTFSLLIAVCNHFDFDSKSAICVYLFGLMGYFVKSLLFFIPYFWLNKGDNIHLTGIRRLIVWSPFILFFIWFTTVITFQIEAFQTDIEYGYIMRFPHFLVQLLVVLLVCIGSASFVYHRYKQLEQAE